MRTVAPFVSASVSLALAAAGTATGQTLNDLYPELATLVAADAATADEFGTSISLSGNTLAVGVPYDDVTLVDRGSVRIFTRSGAVWTLQATLVAADGLAEDWAGYSVSLDGDILAVGSPNSNIGSAADGGLVLIYVRSGTSWAEEASLWPSDLAFGDKFGSAVSLSGGTLAVGMPNDDIGTVVNQGSVRIFTRSGSTWTAQQTITAGDGAASDLFGRSVSIEGDTLAIGVPQDDVGAISNQGSVRIFTRSGSTWTAQQTLTAIDGLANDQFGQTVSLSGDTVAVGVPFDDVSSAADRGSVRMFTRSGTTWTAQQTLTASDGQAGDLFGSSLSLVGMSLVVGAPSDDVGIDSNEGSARTFVRMGNTWSPQATLTASDGAVGDSFGYSVALSGNTIAVGANLDQPGSGGALDGGSVRIFGNHRVWNASRGIGYDSLAAAMTAGFAGDRLLAGAPAFSEADGILDTSSRRFSFVGLEPMTLAPTALLSLATGTTFERSPEVAAAGLTVAGKLIAPPAGTLTFEQLAVGSGGQFLQRNSTVLVNQGLSTLSGGVCYLQGQMLAESVSTAVGGQNRCAGDTDVFGNYTNAGSTIVQRGILYIYGTLVNTGTLTGEVDTGLLPPTPGDGFSIGGDYVAGASASLVLPDPVWWLRVGGDFDVAIDDPARFAMERATLEMTGLDTDPVHTLEALSRDLGTAESGFDPANFPIGTLRIRPGVTVEIVDEHANAPGKGVASLYVGSLVVPAGATLVTNGHRIYAEAATIEGTVSNPADVIVVPGDPPCVADLFIDGVVNGADLGVVLAGWGPCPASCPADINGDGIVNAFDLSFILAGWGPCPTD
jgi:hypothetical protein